MALWPCGPVVAAKAVYYDGAERDACGLRTLDQVQRNWGLCSKRGIVLAIKQSRCWRIGFNMQRVVARFARPQLGSRPQVNSRFFRPIQGIGAPRDRLHGRPYGFQCH